uniref:Uncharacterized protein n=1 Tax=Aegilops tauschii subsp. strangulata TaxID=200361 RepID=A0A453R3H5_AEGTS
MVRGADRGGHVQLLLLPQRKRGYMLGFGSVRCFFFLSVRMLLLGLPFELFWIYSSWDVYV